MPGPPAFILDKGDPSQGLDFQSLFNGLEADAHAYVCGLRSLIDAVSATGRASGWAQANLHGEVFAPSSQKSDQIRATYSLFQVKLRRSGLLLEVRPSDSVLDVVRRAGIHDESAREEGDCGTCLTPVLEGVPDHRGDDLLFTFLYGQARPRSVTAREAATATPHGLTIMSTQHPRLTFHKPHPAFDGRRHR